MSPAIFRLEDSSDRLTQDEKAELNAQLPKVASITGNNVGILIVPTLNGESIETASQRAFSEWSLGDKGTLIVLAMQEHQSRIETGHVVEVTLTDDLCSRILREKLRPHLAQGDVYGALTEGLDAIQAALQGYGDAGTKPQRVGRTFTNGNCALDADHKLTGLCLASDKSGTKCIAHQPDPNSTPCPAGLAVTETRAAACAGGQSGELVSRQHECSFVEEP